MSEHRFQVGQFVKAKASGKLYVVNALRPADWSAKLKGELGYSVIGQRNGKNYGPWRLVRESGFEPAETTKEENCK